MIDPQYLVSTLFFQKVDRPNWNFGDSEIEIEFRDCRTEECEKFVIDSAELRILADKFFAK